MKGIKIIGIDLAKEMFQIHGVDERGAVQLRKQLKRREVLEFFVKLPPTSICMEACGGSNYWARKLKELGHEVKIISAQFVKPFLKSQKNDSNDAEAIVEAASRPSMRFVAPKEIWQQDIQSLHRIRERIKSARTDLVNQARSLLLEYGIAIPEGITHFKNQFRLIVEDGENELTTLMRKYLLRIWEELKSLEIDLEELSSEIEKISQENEICKRLRKVPGIGPLTSTAFVAAVGNPSHFKNGRQVSAWLGLVPRQYSSGGKTRLLGITKRGDCYLRQLMVHGARAVAASESRKKLKNEKNIKFIEEKGTNKAAVAIANHNARVMWAMMKSGSVYMSK